MPKVSVVMPVFNGERFLREAIKSVLEQHFKDFELIAVDDGSSDSSAAILREFPDLRVVTQTNAGQSAARNRGIAEASGDLIAFIDQDDRWYPMKLSRQVAAMDARSHVGLHYSDQDAIDADGRMEVHQIIAAYGLLHPKHSIVDCLRQDMHIIPTAVMFRRKVFDQAGGFDERLSGYEDDDLFLRMFPLTRFEFCPEPLVQWRQYPESCSYSERMDRSRKIFIQKLFEGYPDDPIRQIRYKQDFIVPRFTREYLHRFRFALRSADRPAVDRLRNDLLSTLGPFMTWKQRNRARLMTQEGIASEWIRRLGDYMPLSLRRMAGGG